MTTLTVFELSETHLLLFGAGVLLVFVAATLLRRRTSTLSNVRGPVSTSFWLGNEKDVRYQNEVGDVEFEWLREFGGAWKAAGVMGEEHLYIADPKAMQYVLMTGGYRFPKRADMLAQVRMILGDGILWQHGEQHRRHRQIMNPAFTQAQLKSFLPDFQAHARKLVAKWRQEEIAPSANGEALFNVHSWLSRTTLDIINSTGFGHHIGALDHATNALSKVYDNLFVDSILYPHRWDVVFRSFWHYLPPSVLYYLRYLPSREYARFRGFLNFTRKFGHDLVARSEEKSDSKDIMSVLLRANAVEEERLRLSDSEVIDQISTILLAGHDTSASTLTWWFLELARNPDWQVQVREEVRAARRKLTEAGVDDFSLSDLEGMTVMQATLKESMRLHPIVSTLFRVAGQDEVLPLQHPVVGNDGQQISSIPVRKGQVINISVAAYNRRVNPDVWGTDAAVWNPNRFMHMDKQSMVSLGPYANLGNFAAGVRGCIGWRFAIIEMQAIAATLIENFEFALPPQTKENIVRRKPCMLMAPMAEGRLGIWMGLNVKGVA
ncbi:cytochrome P450 [Peniophora sp. CONT]|nr:cytochrome P450 [Peniophora sp. CONT]